jgi:ankyrin repeat protein
VSNENVYKGVCVRCYGELVPANVFLEWSSANSSAVGNLNPSAQSLVAMNDEPALTSPTSQAGSNLSSPKASFNIQNIDSINKDLQVKYWLLVKFFQSCRNDPLRPTPEDLQGFTNFTGEDWRKVLLIQNETGCLFLHLALMHMAPYTAIHFLLKKDLESSWTIHHEDVNGRIPLHYACQHGATLDVFELLLREDQGDRKKTIYHADKQACFPLHMACQNSCKSTIIQFLLDKDMENRAILKKDSSGHLPIHLALERNATVKIIQMLVNADILKSSLHALNPSGMSTILEIAMRYDYATLLQERHIPLLDTAVEEMNIHTACRFGVPLQSIQILLEMDSNQSIYQTDQDLNLPLHCALDGSASIDTIRYLIKLDTDKSTLYQRNKDGSTPLLKIVLRQDAMAILHGFPSMLHAAEQLDVTDEMNVSIKQKCEVSLELQIKYTRLISIICQRRDLENRPYLSELSNLDFSEETWRRVVLIENDDTGWLPIHWAFAFHAPSAVVEFLIEKDLEHLTIFHRNLSGSLPLHFACLRGFSFEVIHSLLDKDVTRATIHQKNNMGKRPLDLLPKDSDVIPNLVKDVRNNDTTSKTIDFFFQSSPPELFKRAILEIMDSKDCLSWLNHAYCQDAVVIFVVLEFYLLCAWIGVFVYSSILHLKGNDLQIELAITLQAIAFLQLVLKTRRLAKVGSLRSYFAEFYNFLGFATIALVGASSIMLSSKETFGDERALIMATGVLQFTLLLVCLKRVFYSLATFVGGIVQVGLVPGPFYSLAFINSIYVSLLSIIDLFCIDSIFYCEYNHPDCLLLSLSR